MTFCKVVKNKAYFKRYQVKYRRRREGKTDFYARKRMVVQDKNKYNTPKYRLVVRFTNRYVICQIVYSEIVGDKIMAAAYSSELPRYGLTTGLKNYAAAYCTGLLAARRVLTKLGLANKYTGTTEVDGEIQSCESWKGKTMYVPEEQLDEERHPFRCILDVGLRRTTCGARLWGALKGASDGGLDIPHNSKNFPGYDREGKSYDASVHRARIFGGHVAEWMDAMEESNADDFKAHFAGYLKAGIDSEGLEGLYEKVHAAIRADPKPKAKTDRSGYTFDPKYKNMAKSSLEDRKARVAAKKAKRANKLARRMAAAAAAAAGDESD